MLVPGAGAQAASTKLRLRQCQMMLRIVAVPCCPTSSSSVQPPNFSLSLLISLDLRTNLILRVFRHRFIMTSINSTANPGRSTPPSQPEEVARPSQAASIHSRLDLSIKSIRLVRICPELSRRGQIRCDMRHATIDSDYTCISYVWGQPDQGHEILINDQKSIVRKNLFNFLRAGRKKQLG
jgi:hypothetical protein